MKKRILLPILRSGLVVRGFRGVYLFRKKRESAPSSYSILREEKIVREKGQSREVTYGFDEDYLPRLTYSLSFLEGGRAALDYLSVELLEKKQVILFTCRQTFDKSREFILSDADHPDIFSKRAIECKGSLIQEASAEIQCDGFEEGKPLLYTFHPAVYEEGTLKEHKEEGIHGVLSFGNYPLENLFSSKRKESGHCSYLGEKVENTEEGRKKRKGKRVEGIKEYLSALLVGERVFSYEERKKRRSYTYFGKGEDGIRREMTSIDFCHSFFDNYEKEREKGKSLIRLQIRQGEERLTEKDRKFIDVPVFADKISPETDEIIF